MVLGNHSDGPKRITEGVILCSLDNPIKRRKTRNIFKFSAKDLESVQDMFKGILSTSCVIFFIPKIIVDFRTDLHKMKINTELCCKRYEKDPKLSLSELLSG